MSYPPPPPPPPQPPPGYGPSPMYGQQPTYGVVPAGPETHSMAIVSMILGIISLTLQCGPLTGIPALILGYQAKRQIDAEPLRYGGRGMAMAGIILGWIATVLCGGLALLYLGIIIIGALAGS